MKTTKKTLTFALVLAALLCLLVLSASAYDGTQYGSTGIYYRISNGEVTITDAKSDIKTADIPESIDDYPVTSIGSDAFEDCTGLTSVTIPDSVTSIGWNAFCRCTRLTKINWNAKNVKDFNFEACVFLNAGTFGDGIDVVFGDNVKVIPAYAFDGANVKTVTIGNSMRSIGDSAFSGCTGLTSVTIPDSVTSIGEDAFYHCSGLTSVTIGNSVTSIGDSAFENCIGLTKINWNAEKIEGFLPYNRAFSNAGTSGDGIDFVFGDNVKVIPAYAFKGAKNVKSVTIGNNVARIGDYAFYKFTELTSITIPNSVTSIGKYAFEGTAWYDSQPYGDVYAGKVYYKYKGTMLANTKVTIKDGTKGIADCAFNECNSLKSITIPNSVTNIGDSAFYGCSRLKSITIPNSVTRIGDDAFGGCERLKSIAIPNSVRNIGSGAFNECFSLKDIYISDLAAWCNIEFKGSISTFSYKLYLKGNPITNLVVPDNVISISDYAFSRCSGITSITISDSVMSVGDYAFSSCPLTTLKIGKGLKSIGKNAFKGIKVIPEIFYAGNEEEWKGISIDSSNDLILRANMHYNADISHKHSYAKTITKKATCTADGVKTFTCDCGKSYTKVIPATGHKYKTTTTKATTSKNGKAVTACTVCKKVLKTTVIYKASSVKLSKTSYTYNGKTQKPKVVVKNSKGKALTEGKDYTVKYPKGMKNPGTYTVTVTFKGNYSGKKTLTFTIAPKAPTLKVKAGAKKATLSWNKQTGSSGYVVYMATSNNGKYKKLATVKGGSKTSYTAAKLTKGKTVYFKVVSYTASGKTTVRSAYSKPVGAKIK